MRARIVQRSELSASDRENMFLLLKRHFMGVGRRVFNSDLNEKNWVILIENNKDQLVGFSTIYLYRTNYKGETLNVVYSGDTIVDRSAWSSFYLPRIWIKTVKEICSREKSDRVVWLLITSGYRTYRFLPIFWKQYYPKFDVETPSDVRTLIDYLARERFGDQYDQNLGIVKFDHPQKLIHELAIVPEGKLSDPHIAFFNKLNPGHAQGDELVCFAEIDDENLSAAGRRMVSAGMTTKKIA